MTRLLVAMAALLLFVPARADDKADKEKEYKALKGDWKLEKGTLAGNDATTTLKELELTILDDGKYTSKLGDQKDEGKFTFDPKAEPKSMVINPNAGQVKELKAIYKLDGDTLTICYDRTGKETPKKFESTAENKLLLVEYKRKK
jgi:uncharacterized protein (TIGR03067 family)